MTGKEIDVIEVGGFSIGHAQNMAAATGCTAILFDAAAPTGVSIRGGGPASRETPLLAPTAHAESIHAILLSGGSAFGLDAAGGVMRYLEERNIGFDTGVAKVPLVCASCLFDLGIGSAQVRPDADMGYAACVQASKASMPQGTIGAGTGCTVGKICGKARAMKSGIGSYALAFGDVKVGAVVAVNAFGDVLDGESMQPLAGLLNKKKNSIMKTTDVMYETVSNIKSQFSGQNTTIGCIITNAKFNKTQLTKISDMAHNGYARAISPVHTMADGDSIYASSTGEQVADLNTVGTLAAQVMAKAIAAAVRSATTLDGVASMQEIAAKSI